MFAKKWLNGITEVAGNIKCHHGELEITWLTSPLLQPHCIYNCIVYNELF